MGDAKYLCVYRRTMLPRRGVSSDKVGELGREERGSCDRQLTVYSLFWLRLVTNEELEEEIAHDHVYVL